MDVLPCLIHDYCLRRSRQLQAQDAIIGELFSFEQQVDFILTVEIAAREEQAENVMFSGIARQDFGRVYSHFYSHFVILTRCEFHESIDFIGWN